MRKSHAQKMLFGILMLPALVFMPKTFAAETVISPNEIKTQFDHANQLYDQKKFDKAREIYESLVRQGVHDPAALYNLGNACARMGDQGVAVFFYMRALRLSPRDRDIRENLNRLEPGINRGNTFFLLRPLSWLKNLLNLNEWTFGSSLLFSLACVFLGLKFLLRKEGLIRIFQKAAIFFFLLFLVHASFLGFKVYEELIVKTAIVMKADTLARSGPGDQFEELYKLPAGTKIRIISPPQNGWVRMRLMDGRSAYLPLTEIRKIGT
jgi:tetratricopeptide (TPR) repeat protein